MKTKKKKKPKKPPAPLHNECIDKKKQNKTKKNSDSEVDITGERAKFIQVT